MLKTWQTEALSAHSKRQNVYTNNDNDIIINTCNNINSSRKMPILAQKLVLTIIQPKLCVVLSQNRHLHAWRESFCVFFLKMVFFHFSLKMSQEFREYANYDEYIRAHPEYEASFAAEKEVLEESFEDSSVSFSASLERFKHSREEMKEILRVYGSFQECYVVLPTKRDRMIIESISREELDGEPNAFL